MKRFFRKKNRSFIPVGWALVSTWGRFPEWRNLLFEESDSASSYALAVALRLRTDYDERGFTDLVIDQWTLASLEFEYDFLKKIGSAEIVLQYGVFFLKLPYRSFVDGDLLEEIQPRLQEIDNRSNQGNRPRYYLSIKEASEKSLFLEDKMNIHIGDYESSFEGNGSKSYSIFAHQIVLRDKGVLKKFNSEQLSKDQPDKSRQRSSVPTKYGWGVFGMIYSARGGRLEKMRIRLTEPGLSYEDACLTKEEFEDLRAKGIQLPGQGGWTFDELKVMRDLRPTFRKIR